MTSTKKSVAAVACAVALAGSPAAAHAVAPTQVPTASQAQGGFAGATADVAAPPVRVVAPGERLDAGAGVELWLTQEGKHWSTPEMDYQFRSVVDGNIDMHKPGVGLTAEPLGDRYFLSGIYVTERNSVQVVVDTSDGKVTASVIRLPGTPGWGTWYADVPLHDDLTIDSVTLYDKRGKKIASLIPSRP